MGNDWNPREIRDNDSKIFLSRWNQRYAVFLTRIIHQLFLLFQRCLRDIKKHRLRLDSSDETDFSDEKFVDIISRWNRRHTQKKYFSLQKSSAFQAKHINEGYKTSWSGFPFIRKAFPCKRRTFPFIRKTFPWSFFRCFGMFVMKRINVLDEKVLVNQTWVVAKRLQYPPFAHWRWWRREGGRGYSEVCRAHVPSH